MRRVYLVMELVSNECAHNGGSNLTFFIFLLVDQFGKVFEVVRETSSIHECFGYSCPLYSLLQSITQVIQWNLK